MKAIQNQKLERKKLASIQSFLKRQLNEMNKLISRIIKKTHQLKIHVGTLSSNMKRKLGKFDIEFIYHHQINKI